jgi:hypothetical protein
MALVFFDIQSHAMMKEQLGKYPETVKEYLLIDGRY